MNANAKVDEFYHWREAVKLGRGVETERGNPRSGYYRVKNEAIAFWRDADGAVLCWRSRTFRTPKLPDEIEELFAYCAPHPVTYEVFKSFREIGRWPDEVEPIAPASADLPPSAALTAELTALREQAKTWLAGIGAVKTKEDADKSANFADAFAKLEKRATETHKAEKAPHLDAGRAVDATWKPIIEDAGACKTWAKKAAEAYLIAEKRRLAEEEAKRQEAVAKAQREAEQARADAERLGYSGPPPVAAPTFEPPPVPEKAKAGTSGRVISVRTRTVSEIVDLRAFLAFLGTQNDLPADLLDALRKHANRLVAAGFKPPGVETKIIEEVA